MGPLHQNHHDWLRLIRRQFHNQHESMLFESLLGLLAGNWLACIAIPLDWGRIWQKWPIPNMIAGSILFLISSLLSTLIACWKGRRLVVPVVEIDLSQRRSKLPSPTKKSNTMPSPKKKGPRAVSRTPKKQDINLPKRSNANMPELETPNKRTTRTPRATSTALTTPRKTSRSPSGSRSRTPKRATKGSSPRKSPSRSTTASPRRSSRRI